ncbi:MAG: hypothetical protein AAFU79_28195 [Myxococcota bacterium]
MLRFFPQAGFALAALSAVAACSQKSSPPHTGAEDGGGKSPSPPAAPERAPAPAPERALIPALPAVPRATGAEAKHLEDTLRALVLRGSSEDGFPWALAHGLIAFGPDLETDAGRPAVDAIASHLRELEAAGRTVHRLPARTDKGLPVEAHPDAALLSMLSSGVPLDRPLAIDEKRKVTLRQLISDAEWVFSMPTTDRGWHQFAWSATLFMKHRGGRGEVLTARGPIPLLEIAEAALGRTEKDQAFLLPALRAGRPQAVQKRRQGIFGHSCGGLHLVQAGVKAAPLLGAKSASRLREQLDIVAFRWVAERTLYRDNIRKHPEYAPLLLVQELKIFGHVLETLAFAAEWAPAVIAPRDRELYAKVTVDLARTVEQLKPIYAAHASLRKASAQTYYDLIGDGCHAVRGLAAGRAIFLSEASTGTGSE